MDFLRQLHPAASQRPEAARVDAGAWQARVQRPSRDDVEADEQEAGARRWPAVQGGPLASVAAGAPTATSATPIEATTIGATGAAEGRMASAQHSHGDDALDASRHALTARRDGPPASQPPVHTPAPMRPQPWADASPPATGADAVARAEAIPRADPVPRAALVRLPTSPSVAPLQQRPTPAIAAAMPTAAATERDSDPAPIVHVTIDRIDVRLPPAPATPPVAARAARSDRSTPLADYLRGRGVNGGAR